MQTFTAPVDGNYKLEVWGAQGASGGSPGGKGGYSKAIYIMDREQTIYVAVGAGYGHGNGWNGGGFGLSKANHNVPSGGGATSIQTSLISDGQLYHYESVKETDVLIVAGGGGGSEWYYSLSDETTPVGGTGGGTIGGDGATGYISGLQSRPGAKGGTQNAGGKSTALSGGSQSIFDGSFGRGGHTEGGDGGGQGGGGWYGGGAADSAGGGGGGSGHIGTMLTNGETIAGDQIFPSPSGGTETGHSGNGYAIITWQQLP